jgi:hypothetical protein
MCNQFARSIMSKVNKVAGIKTIWLVIENKQHFTSTLF